MPTEQLVMERNCIECKLGVVVALDKGEGTLTLAYGDGTCARLTAAPSSLTRVRMGGPVQVMVDGGTVLTLRCL
jgi:hypothetical protein